MKKAKKKLSWGPIAISFGIYFVLYFILIRFMNNWIAAFISVAIGLGILEYLKRRED